MYDDKSNAPAFHLIKKKQKNLTQEYVYIYT